MKNKVVLFHPPYDGPPLGPPLSLLSLASPLLAAGFQVSIVDASIDPEYKSSLASEITGALCLGISLLTGRMIRSAVDVSRFVREIHPGLPIIYGGWHPSLLPAQTLREDFVDAVVRGQGELTLREAAERLRMGSSFESVRGVSFKPHGERCSQCGTARGERGAPAHARVCHGKLRCLREEDGGSETSLRFQRRMSLRLPLLHGPGVLQPALQCLQCRPRGFRGHRTRGALSLERSGLSRLQLPGQRQAGRGNCQGLRGLQAAVSLDLPGFHRPVMPHDRRRGRFAGRSRGFPYGVRHGIGLAGSPCSHEQEASAHRRDVRDGSEVRAGGHPCDLQFDLGISR